MKTENRFNEACEAIERELAEWVEGSRWVINGKALELHGHKGHLKTVIPFEDTDLIIESLEQCSQFNYEKMIKNEGITKELNPYYASTRSYELPNGFRFDFHNYVWKPDQLTVEAHYYYESINKYVVYLLPSEWLNDIDYYNGHAKDTYFVKFVHQLDMSENS
jgi:hypothetical protein